MNLRLPAIIHSRPHLSTAIVLGIAATLIVPETWPWQQQLLACWNVVVWTYLVTMAWMMAQADHHDIKRAACRQDERGPVILAVLSLAVMLSLVAIISQLAAGKPTDDLISRYALSVATLIGSWFMVGVMFCSHYAHLYYIDDSDDKPLGFPDDDVVPNYWDFLYFSFTISVAVQTSDVTVRNRGLRQVVLGQSILCFFYNLAILGLSINIAASLLNG
jgi:uncharacterized membrane protein